MTDSESQLPPDNQQIDNQQAAERQIDDRQIDDRQVDDRQIDEGPGWMPALLAGTVLMGIFGFVCFGVSTAYLYSQRAEIATRTITKNYLPELEQSQLEPDDKKAVVAKIRELGTQLENGRFDNDTATGIMTRLQSLPVLQWGHMQAVHSTLRKLAEDTADPADAGDSADAASSDAAKILDQFESDWLAIQSAVAAKKVTAYDFQDLLKPVLIVDPDEPSGYRLDVPMDSVAAEDVANRMQIFVKQRELPPHPPSQPAPAIADLISNAINDGIETGSL
ncbi:MAG: hypothetical protein AAF958_00040 [Planctomycetota bacterium]